MSVTRGPLGGETKPYPGPDPRSARVGPTNGNANGNGNSMVGRITDFGNDVFTLSELQAKLALFDAKECAERAITPLVMAIGGLLLLAGAVPVAMLGIADLLAKALNVAPGWAMLLTALIGAAVAGLVIFVSGRTVVASFTAFRRSREEFERNLAWIRTVLVHSGRPVARRKV